MNSRPSDSSSRRERIVAVAVAGRDSTVHVVNLVFGAEHFRVGAAELDGLRFRPELPEGVRIAGRLRWPPKIRRPLARCANLCRRMASSAFLGLRIGKGYARLRRKN